MLYKCRLDVFFYIDCLELVSDKWDFEILISDVVLKTTQSSFYMQPTLVQKLHFSIHCSVVLSTANSIANVEYTASRRMKILRENT